MKDSESQKSTSHQSAVRRHEAACRETSPKPFFGAKPDRAFFTAERSQSTPFFQLKASSFSTLQAKSANDEVEELNQPALQKMPAFESELTANEEVQLREKSPATLQTKADEGTSLKSQEASKTPNQTGLPKSLKTGVENLSGYSLDDVRVHYNSPKPAQLQALAYTQGTEIHVAPGQEKHLPHEAWHVVQQMQGRVKPIMQMKGVQINDDEGLEREADAMGEKANRGRGEIADELPDVVQQTRNNTENIIQRVPFNNLEAKFRTDNGDPNIDDSEYHVTQTGYERYAPINKYRLPSQFYHEGERTFMYFSTEDNAVKFNTYLQNYYLKGEKNADKIKFQYFIQKQKSWQPMPGETEAKWQPQDGYLVFDCKMNDSGLIKSAHFGHPVKDLGKPLPELDKPKKVEQLRILQTWMQHVIDTKQLGTENKDEKDLLQAWENARKAGSINSDEWKKYQKYVEYINDIFGAMEKELIENWRFWTM